MQASRRHRCARGPWFNVPACWRALFIAVATFGIACGSGESRVDVTPGPTAIAETPTVGTLTEALVATTTLPASGDTYVRSGLPNQNMGGDTRLSLQSLGRHRALLFFGASNITSAVGSGTLVSARIELTLAPTPSGWGPSGRSIAIHRLKQATAEYEATWNCARDANLNNLQDDCSGATAWSMNATTPALQPWLSPPTAQALVTNGLTGVVSFDVTADIAAILAGSDAGHGWLIKKVDENQAGSLDFASREQGGGPRLLLAIDGASGGGGLGPVTGSASVSPVADTYVRQGLPNQSFGEETGLGIQAAGRNRALVDFDAATVTGALGGALVRARLKLPIAETADNWGPDRAVGAHRLRRAWSELGATWNCALDANPNNISADCSGASAWVMFGAASDLAWVNPPTGTTLISNGQTGVLELDVTRDVACALAGLSPLDGWLIKKELESQGGRIELSSRETATPPSLLLEWTNENGVVVTAADCAAQQPPPNGCTPTAPVDTTCNGVDDDCDGQVDEDYSIVVTACGTGACTAAGVTSCVAGQVVDSCTPTAPAANDSECNLIDDDCNDIVDEDYIGIPTSCGVGACSATGLTDCVLGQVLDGCQPNDPAPSDSSCDGVDDDCSGSADDDYVAVATSCGVGACTASGSTSCASGQVVDDCTSGTPAAADATCDLADDDCDGAVDDDYLATTTSCGVGACQASGSTSCVLGQVTDSCTPASAAPSDGSCNGVDDDCSGSADEDYVAVATSCGVGACTASGSTSCASGQVVDGCTPGTAAASDATCNQVDDDCDGSVDDDYLATTTSCGVGACQASGSTSCVLGQVTDSCTPANPAASDSSCDGVDDDCDGLLDQDFVATCSGASVQRCVGGNIVPIDCGDTNPCNGSETCSDGACQAGTSPDLDDGNDCTEDVCDATSGIAHVARPESTPCSDFAECDNAGQCVSFLPPDPATVAPDLPGGNVSLLERMRFLFESDPPIQTGLTPETIEPRSAAVLRGRVLDRDGEPLPNVQVTIHSHPEFGQTLSRLDGNYDLLVNGGGLLTVEYAREGFFLAQRTLRVPWQDFAFVDDVALVEADLMVTQMDFPSLVPQVHQASASIDADGVRVAALHVNSGTEAQLRLPDGSSIPASSLAIRATEYTVGPTGRAAMPAELPATSGYTYAVELSADEAEAAGAQHVEFNQPVSFLVDNFLDFPTGTIVPVGSYDREAARWVGEANGRVMEVLGSTGGLADIDVDGSGDPADAAALTAFGISAEERQSLAGLYTPGTSFWRVTLLHFTPIDCNQPVAAATGEGGSTPAAPAGGGRPLDRPKEQCSSIIEVENQNLGERLPIAGTAFSLNYRSDRVLGRSAERTIQIPVTGPTVSNTLLGADVKVSVAGRSFSFGGFPPAPNQSFTFSWDGLDKEGRALQGRQRAVVNVGASYPLRYAQPGTQAISFGLTATGGGAVMGPARDPGSVTFYTAYELDIGSYDNRQQALGGWSLSAHHTYDPMSRTLYLGDGTRRSTNSISDTIGLFAGVPHFGVASNTGDGGPARNAVFDEANAVALGPDGAVYVGTRLSIRRIDPDTQIVTTIAGGKSTTTCNPNLIDGPPGDMCLYPKKLDIGPDGGLYMSDNPIGGGTVDRIRRLDLATGLMTHIAGRAPGTNCANRGDGGPARDAAICSLISHATAPDGSIYVLDRGPTTNGGALRKISPNGIIDSIAAMGWAGNDDSADVAVAPDGSVYVNSGSTILRILPSGVQQRFAGIPNQAGSSGDGGLAINALLSSNPWALAVAPDGRVFIGDFSNRVIRLVDQLGIINRAVGDSAASGLVGDGGPSLQAGLGGAGMRMTVAADGSLYFASRNNSTIRVVRPAIDGNFSGEMLVPAESGNEVYRFDANGRHLETRHALTGGLLYTFQYDGDGRLSAVIDGDGNQTSIERSEEGEILAIVAPFGQETRIEINDDGYVATITEPSGAQRQFGYDGESGLLTSQVDARGGQHAYAYDAGGMLISDENAGDGHITLSRTGGAFNSTVTRVTAEGLAASYATELLSNAVERRTVTREDGRTERTDTRPDKQTTTTMFDGTIVTSTPGPDPVWGTLRPLSKTLTERRPSGSTLSMAETRTAVLSNPLNPLSLTSDARGITVNGRTWTTGYDHPTRTLTMRSPLGRQTQALLDERGRITRVSSPGLFPTLYGYDTAGRLTSIVQGARSHTLDYDSNGKLAALTDALGKTEAFAYDTDGRLIELTRADGSIVGFDYDSAGNIVQVVPAGRPGHQITYTQTDVVDSFVSPDVGAGVEVMSYVYDDDDRLREILRADGSSVQVAYDAAGRVRTITLPTGALTLGYFSTTGHLQSVNGPAGVNLTFQRDGDLITSTLWSGAVSGAVGRNYDTFRRLSSQTVNGANPITFGYNDDGLLTSAGVLALGYDPSIPLPSTMSLGQVQDSFSYDQYGELATHVSRFGTTELLAQALDADERGQIQQNTETVAGVTTSYAYGYDDIGQVVDVTVDGVLQRQYSYDDNGNRLSLDAAGTFTDALYDDQDRLLEYGDLEYTYTEDGAVETKLDLTNGDLTNYTYDALGNLIAVELPDGRLIEYVVDGMSRRVGKKVDGSFVQKWLYDGSQLVAELDGAGTLVKRFVFASHPTIPDFMMEGGTNYRLVADYLGSVRRVVNVANSADVPLEASFDEFGRVSGRGLASIPFGFAGGLYDGDTGLIRFGARDYDPVIGRWTNKDPVRWSGGQANLYVYVGNDPINLVDPSGMQVPSNVGAGLQLPIGPGFEPTGSPRPVADPPGGMPNPMGPMPPPTPPPPTPPRPGDRDPPKLPDVPEPLGWPSRVPWPLGGKGPAFPPAPAVWPWASPIPPGTGNGQMCPKTPPAPFGMFP